MQTDHRIPKSTPKLPIVEIDDFDIDGLGFKPVNKGLGFHGERETKVQKRSFTSTQKQRSFTSKSTLKSSLQHTSESIPLDNPMGGIEQFYNSNSFSYEKDIHGKKVENKVNLNEAKLVSRLCAFIFDCSVIFSSSLFIFGLFVLTIYSALGSSLIKSFVIENLDFFILLNGVIYIIYFTLWDAVGTFGKLLMNIEVVSENKDELLTMTQLFNRSVLSLFGMLLLFIPNIIDLHTKLSRTKTVEM